MMCWTWPSVLVVCVLTGRIGQKQIGNKSENMKRVMSNVNRSETRSGQEMTWQATSGD